MSSVKIVTIGLALLKSLPNFHLWKDIIERVVSVLWVQVGHLQNLTLNIVQAILSFLRSIIPTAFIVIIIIDDINTIIIIIIELFSKAPLIRRLKRRRQKRSS